VYMCVCVCVCVCVVCPRGVWEAKVGSWFVHTRAPFDPCAWPHACSSGHAHALPMHACAAPEAPGRREVGGGRRLQQPREEVLGAPGKVKPGNVGQQQRQLHRDPLDGVLIFIM
jgi:hypothetical protein